MFGLEDFFRQDFKIHREVHIFVGIFVCFESIFRHYEVFNSYTF